MVRPVFQPLFAQYRQTIREMPASFSSHEFIARLTQENQQEYIAALVTYPQSSAPFKVVHSVLARHLNAFPRLIRQDGAAIDLDIFGDFCACAKWRKIR